MREGHEQGDDLPQHQNEFRREFPTNLIDIGRTERNELFLPEGEVLPPPTVPCELELLHIQLRHL
jgi:hypothetical protein